MKRYLIMALLGALLSGCSAVQQTSAPTAGDSSRVSVDWVGTYEGVFPCADCSGLKMTLTLKPEGIYKETVENLDRRDTRFISEGRFQWNDEGSKITLSNKKKYLVGENQVFLLDSDGNRAKGEMADQYRLIKLP